MANDLYSPAQLAALTGLAVGNQRNWRRDGFFRKHGVQGAGGYWKFSKHDVLYVAAVRALAEEYDLGIAVAGMLADTFFLEILAAVQRKPREPGEAKYVFAWKRKNSTFEAEDALAADGYLHLERWTDGKGQDAALYLYQAGEWCAVQTNYLDNDHPRLSRTGGIIIVPEEIGWSIPPAVSDLFTAGAAK